MFELSRDASFAQESRAQRCHLLLGSVEALWEYLFDGDLALQPHVDRREHPAQRASADFVDLDGCAHSRLSGRNASGEHRALHRIGIDRRRGPLAGIVEAYVDDAPRWYPEHSGDAAELVRPMHVAWSFRRRAVGDASRLQVLLPALVLDLVGRRYRAHQAKSTTIAHDQFTGNAR